MNAFPSENFSVDKPLKDPLATPSPWHDPKELEDRLNQPKVTYEEALAQTRRVMSQQRNGTSVPPSKKKG